MQTNLIPTLELELQSKQIMKELCIILNIYQLNIYVLNLKFKVKNGSIPDAFQNNFDLKPQDYFTKNDDGKLA